MPSLTPHQWFWFCYAALGLFGGLRVAANQEFRSFSWSDRCFIWALTVCFWPIDFFRWLYYIYRTYVKRTAK